MNIHEYQSKELFNKFGIPVPAGIAISSAAEVKSAVKKLKPGILVVKAQIHAGGRGKAGGVKVVKSAAEAVQVVESMLGSTLVTHQTGPAGQKVRRIYIEEGAQIKKEYYIGAVIDRKLSRISFIFSSEGGVEIEEVAKQHPEKIIGFSIDPACGFQNFQGRKLGFGLKLSATQVAKLTDIAQKMYNVFINTDASQVEINPLVETANGDFVALDAKISFDDNSLYRHPEIFKLRDYDEEVVQEVEASKYGLNYVKMEGSIGCMVNGAGLAMATMDIIKYYGSSPANFLDVGGGATRENVTEALKIILSDNKVEGILVNIFGGIMRCDIIAEGIVEATRDVSIKVPLVVRLSGTNFERGKKILSDSGLNIVIADDLGDAAQKIVNLVKK